MLFIFACGGVCTLVARGGPDAGVDDVPARGPGAPPAESTGEQTGEGFDTSLRLERSMSVPEQGNGIPRASLFFSERSHPAVPLIDEQTDLSFLDAPIEGGGPVHIRFKRPTELVDGGFGQPSATDATATSYFESPGERFERYALSLEWVPAGRDSELQWLVIGGLHAIRADIGKLNETRLGLTEAHGTVAFPTVGTGIRWSPSDSFSLSTTASTRSLDQSANMLELILSAQMKLSPTVGITAGYEIFRTDLTVKDLQTSLDREGIFARLSIRF